MANEGCLAGTTSAARRGTKQPSAESSRGKAIACHGCDGSLARSIVVCAASRAHIRVSVSDGTMIILSSCIGMLRDGGGRSRSNRVHVATSWHLFRTLFHHASASPLAVQPVSVAMVETPMLAPLMPKASLSQALAARRPPAITRAIAIAAIASRAEEEDLPATR